MRLPTPRLIGLPYDASSSFRSGAAEAPWFIRRELRSPAGNGCTEDFHDLAVPGAFTDAGDLSLPATPEARTLIESGIVRLLADGFRPLALGGDHSVTYPVLRAINTVYPRPTILHLDAHPDLYAEFEGDRFSHACPFARIMEERLASRLIQVGIRAMNGPQREQARLYQVDVIDMRAWVAGTRPVVEGPVYVSIDLDVLDPAFAPGVSHREPGGLSVREVLGIVQGLEGMLVGADVVEFNPREDISGLTARVAAKLVEELAGHMLASAANSHSA
jgi:arginase